MKVGLAGHRHSAGRLYEAYGLSQHPYPPSSRATTTYFVSSLAPFVRCVLLYPEVLEYS